MGKRVIDGPATFEMSPDADDRARAAIEQADRDTEEMRVNMRWGRAHLEVVKQAAGFFGMPYQTYVKQAAFRQAIADLRAAQEVESRLSGPF